LENRIEVALRSHDRPEEVRLRARQREQVAPV
jgi:hypothetical protein